MRTIASQGVAHEATTGVYHVATPCTFTGRNLADAFRVRYAAVFCIVHELFCIYMWATLLS